jgi:cobalt-precorrin-5B (C1)-methyltransferase
MLTLKRFGITTGAAAAAAAKAATLSLRGESPRAVTIPTPIGLRLEIPVERVYRDGEWHCAEVKKFSGDNPDVLDGVVIKGVCKAGSA